jgi:hypothetical protein
MLPIGSSNVLPLPRICVEIFLVVYFAFAFALPAHAGFTGKVVTVADSDSVATAAL